MILPYVETAIAFSLVMLAGALIVNIVVRLLLAARGDRARGVEGMLAQLHRGFSEERGLRPNDQAAAQKAFVDDVLTAPVLHDARQLAAADGALAHARREAGALRDAVTREPKAARAEALRQRADRLEQRAFDAWRTELYGHIEYLRKQDLLAILRGWSVAGDAPVRWFGAAPVQNVPEAARPFYPAGATRVSARDLHDYADRWFRTVSATVEDRFAVDARRHGAWFSLLVVVALNLDAIRLARDLYADRALTERLGTRQDDVADLSRRYAPPTDALDTAPPTTADLTQSLERASTVLAIERVPFGWQDSWIARRWCAYQGACDDPTVPTPNGKEMIGEVFLWLIGMVSSWLLLTLGAPFWVRILKRLSGLVSTLAGRDDDTLDHQSDVTRWDEEAPAEPPPTTEPPPRRSAAERAAE